MNGATGTPHPIRIGLVADDGLPADLAEKLAPRLPSLLSARVSADHEWEVETVRESMPLVGDGQLPIFDSAEQLMPEHQWDMIACLTELPRWIDDRPVTVEIFHDRRVALVSTPALGWFGIRRRISHAVERLADGFLDRTLRADDAAGVDGGPDERVESHRLTSGPRGWLRLLSGMVRHNRPWRLVPSLDRAIAAAVATAAFPIFYSSIWGMAEALSIYRLTLVTALAVLAMVGWLILHNGLCDRRRHRRDHGRTAVYNASTFITILIGVLCMYVLLVLIALLAALVVIPGGYLETTLGKAADLTDYVKLAWLASSMGTFAGAVGASFETETAIRRATYSKREHERRQRDQSRRG